MSEFRVWITDSSGKNVVGTLKVYNSAVNDRALALSTGTFNTSATSYTVVSSVANFYYWFEASTADGRTGKATAVATPYSEVLYITAYTAAEASEVIVVMSVGDSITKLGLANVSYKFTDANGNIKYSGIMAGVGGESCKVIAGNYKVELSKSGYVPKTYSADISTGMAVYYIGEATPTGRIAYLTPSSAAIMNASISTADVVQNGRDVVVSFTFANANGLYASTYFEMADTNYYLGKQADFVANCYGQTTNGCLQSDSGTYWAKYKIRDTLPVGTYSPMFKASIINNSSSGLCDAKGGTVVGIGQNGDWHHEIILTKETPPTPPVTDCDLSMFKGSGITTYTRLNSATIDALERQLGITPGTVKMVVDYTQVAGILFVGVDKPSDRDYALQIQDWKNGVMYGRFDTITKGLNCNPAGWYWVKYKVVELTGLDGQIAPPKGEMNLSELAIIGAEMNLSELAIIGAGLMYAFMSSKKR